MHSKLINSNPKTFVVVFETGDEVPAGLKKFAQDHKLDASHFSGIGAFSDITLGFFNLATRDYNHTQLKEQVEVLSLLGNVTLEEEETKIHAHVVVGKADGTAHGGHLIQAHVRPTLELVVEESPEHLRRKFNTHLGLALITTD
jgi:predicted DNA-binding protein with PD1-like motif